MVTPDRYLLGDSEEERTRLTAQADLWDPVSRALFDRLQVAPGWRVLELGPGAGSLNLELRRRIGGPVDVVEQSTRFCEALASRWRDDGLGAGRIWNGPLLEADLPADHYDLVFVRWVFLFLPQPAVHLHALVRALKPGGLIAIQDYYRNTFCLVPTPRDWPALVEADLAFFATGGADANTGAKLPGMFDACGLDLVGIEPHIKTGRPGSLVWGWLSTYYLSILDTYATLGPLTPDAAGRIRTAWQAAQRDPQSLLIAPTVLDVVGRRR